MLTFFARHGGTLLVAAVVLGIVILIIRHLIKRRKQGRCASCSGCGHKGKCGGQS